MKYEYYEKIEFEEHWYFAEEIFTSFYNVLPKDAKPSDIHLMIKRYLKHSKQSVRKLYYMTSKGLKRVYPYELAADAIVYHIEQRNKIKDGDQE